MHRDYTDVVVWFVWWWFYDFINCFILNFPTLRCSGACCTPALRVLIPRCHRRWSPALPVSVVRTTWRGNLIKRLTMAMLMGGRITPKRERHEKCLKLKLTLNRVISVPKKQEFLKGNLCRIKFHSPAHQIAAWMSYWPQTHPSPMYQQSPVVTHLVVVERCRTSSPDDCSIVRYIVISQVIISDIIQHSRMPMTIMNQVIKATRVSCNVNSSLCESNCAAI